MPTKRRFVLFLLVLTVMLLIKYVTERPSRAASPMPPPARAK